MAAAALRQLYHTLRRNPPHTRSFSALSSLFREPKVAREARGQEESDSIGWKEKELEILRDVKPTISLAKHILHSNRYLDGECLNSQGAKMLIKKLLAYLPNSKEKMGYGSDAIGIMVDRHPKFVDSRCLFVVTFDGHKMGFSYQKCLRAYIRSKYPAEAERFIGKFWRHRGQ